MRRCVLGCLLCLVSAIVARGQNLDAGMGFQTYGSYHSSDFDSVNLLTGNVVLHIPLISFPQRGDLPDLTLSVVWNNYGWTSGTYYDSEGFPVPFSNFNGGSPWVGWLADSVAGFSDGAPGSSCYPTYSVVDWSGAVHPMGYLGTSPGSPFIFRSLDGAGYEIQAPSAPRMGCSPPTLPDVSQSGWQNTVVTAKNGIQNSGTVNLSALTNVRDRNGNLVAFYTDWRTYFGYTDSLNRNIPLPSTIWPGYGASGPAGCVTLNYPGPPSSGGTVPITYCYSVVTIAPPDNSWSKPYNMLQSVTLPNGRVWTFQYDSYGDLTQVTTPTGGTVSYSWGGPGVNYIDNAGDTVSLPSVQYRDVNDGSGTKRWQYNLSFPSNTTVNVVTDPDGNDTVHVSPDTAPPFYETETRYYNGSSANSANLIKTVDTAYIPTGTQTWTSSYLLPTTVTTTLSSGQVSETCIYYDNQDHSGSGVCPSATVSASAPTFWSERGAPWNYQAVYGDEVERDDYDYGSGAVGALLRKTVTSYKWGDPNYLSANLLDRVSQITIYDGGGQKAQTTFGYDEPGNGNAVCVCGNLTSVTSWLVSGNNAPTRYVYNGQGMRTQLYHPNDADGDPSEQYFYDGTGLFLDHITYRDGTERFGYDSNTGVLIDHYGLNSEHTHYAYDNMRRLTDKTQPDGGIEHFDFNDNGPSFTFTKQIRSGVSYTETGVVDGLGRQIRTDTLVPTTTCYSGHIYVDTTYDGEGRKRSESNPYCASYDSTYGITNYYYDGLGRICVVVPPDGTIPSSPCPSTPPANDVYTSYSGNVTTVTDEASNQRRSYSDALGRLVRVDEPAGSAASSGSGSFTVYGSEQPPTAGTPGQKQFTLGFTHTACVGSPTGMVCNGYDQSQTFPNTPGSGYVVISGVQSMSWECGPFYWDGWDGYWTQDCYWFNDSGDVWVSVNGWLLSVTYDWAWDGSVNVNDNSSSLIASVLADAINSTAGYPVTAWAQDWGDGYNATLWLTATQPGSQTNYSLSAGSDGDAGYGNYCCQNGTDYSASPSGANLTGGSDYTLYDSGNVWININGYHLTGRYDQTTSLQTVVNNLISNVNSDSYLYIPSSSSNSLTLQARSVGQSTNYPFTAGATPDRPDVFSQASFYISPAGTALTGGADGNPYYDSGTISISVNGYSQTVTYGQASTTSSLASALANFFNTNGSSPVNAFVSGSTITFVAKAVGSASNYSVSTNCLTSSPGVFTHPSYYWTSSAPSSTTCPTGSGALSGGVDGGSLSAPMITLYTYDALDNLIGVQQRGGDSNSANWRNRTFNYDGMSRLTSAYNPESGTMGYGYDSNSNLKTKTTPLGTISYCYDAMNRLTSKSYNNTSNCSSPVATYGYDGNAPSGCSPSLSISNPLGHRTGMCDQAGSEAWSYDLMGRPVTDQRVTNNHTGTTGYAYNNDGSVYQVTYPTNRTVTYDPNIVGQPKSAIDNGNNITYANTALYAPHGALRSMIYGGGTFPLLSSYYNSRLQPCRIAVNTSGTAPGYCSDNYNTANIMDFTYDFHLGSGDNGNVYRISNNRADATNRGINYRYDPVNRLAGAFTNGNLWGESYQIDGWGNLKAIGAYFGRPTGENLSQGANTQNQLTNLCSGTCYDAAGDVINDGLYTYAYDVEGHLVSAAGKTYGYDGDGKRVMKSSGGNAYELYWYGMGSNVLDETDQNTNLLNEYVFFGGKRVAQRNSSGIFYYFADHLGTSRTMVQAGQTTPCYDADFYPFGGELPPYTNTCPQNYKFTGKERDSETGLDNFGARFDTSRFARFMSPDPIAGRIGNPQSLNAYSYVWNNPLSLTDPTGMVVCWDDEDSKRKSGSTNCNTGESKLRSKYESRIQSLLDSKNEKDQARGRALQETYQRLQDASELFHVVRTGGNGSGELAYYGTPGQLYVEMQGNGAAYGQMPDLQKLGHEFEHGAQFLDGLLGFAFSNGKWQGYRDDLVDEANAFIAGFNAEKVGNDQSRFLQGLGQAANFGTQAVIDKLDAPGSPYRGRSKIEIPITTITPSIYAVPRK